MAKNLVIVESPSKASTIKKMLGNNYKVMASNGHIIDLPKSTLGIDIDNDFEPKYITIRGKGPLLTELKKEAKKATNIYLATDPDREGEAISWHLSKALTSVKEDKNIKRITFNEITKSAIKDSLKNPRDIDKDLVDAQQARRVLDRIVGYSISPILWEKVKSGLSAGRVQSVALKIICDREKEINDFVPKEYFTLDIDVKKGLKTYEFKFVSDQNGEKEILSKEHLDVILKSIKDKDIKITSIKTGKRKRQSDLPYTTSKLQQDASNILNFSPQKTMSIAQKLYEGVNVNGNHTGLITYLRTDSTRVSNEAIELAKKFISNEYGDEYNLKEEKKVKSKKIQDAHEAIRPTYIEFVPEDIKENLSKDEYKLYNLIWKRFVASRMSNAEYETKTILIDINGVKFSLSTSKLLFDGFLKVKDEKKEKEKIVEISDNDILKLAKTKEEQHFTTPPPRYTEASLVKELEELGIGRPSTYAPTIYTIIKRRYITIEKKSIYVTELGEVINMIMEKGFSEIIDTSFTAKLEEKFDEIANGSFKWKEIVGKFYDRFIISINDAKVNLEKIELKDEVSDEICEKCGKNLVIKYGKYGKFLACPGFPECSNIKPYKEKTGVVCEKCGGDIVINYTKKGRKYYSCSNYPNCENMMWKLPDEKKHNNIT